MTSLRAVISEILQSRDFQVSERDGFLTGKRKDVEVIFLLLADRDDKAISDFTEHFKEFKGKRVIATLLPLPEAVQIPPPAPTQVQVAVKAAGNMSATVAPVALPGPAFEAVMV